MKILHLIGLTILINGIVACGKDEDPPPPPEVTALISTDSKLYVWDANGDGTPDIKPGQTQQEVSGGEGRLIRFKDDIFASVVYVGADPANVYTMWIAIFNKPENCTDGGAVSRCGVADLQNADVEASLMVAGGMVPTPEGRINFNTTLAEGDTTGVQVGNGMSDAEGADIHLIVRNKGPAETDLEMLRTQITTFGMAPNIATSPHEASRVREFTGRVTRSDVYWWDQNRNGTPDGKMGEAGFMAINGSSSMMIRDGDEVFATLSLKGLPPGDVLTVWMAVFNNPSVCTDASVEGKFRCLTGDLGNPDVNASVTNARSGWVVRPDGSVILGGRVRRADLSAAQTGNGLVEVESSDIHVIGRNHGQLLSSNTASVSLQLNTFNGGCNGPCPNFVTSPHHAADFDE